MSELRVAARYAKSLIDLSLEEGNLEQVHNDVSDFLIVLGKNPQIGVIMKSPVVKNDDKNAIIGKLFKGKYQNNLVTFFDIIIRKNRSALLQVIALNFVDQYHEIKNIMKATVKTSIPVNAGITAEIKSFMEKFTGKQIILQSSVDPRLIGGLVIQMGDKLFDASISGRLKKIKHELLNTYISK